MSGGADIIVHTADSLDIGLHTAIIKLCREFDTSICTTTTFKVSITPDCLQPADVTLGPIAMTYTIGAVAAVETVSYPLQDACSGLVLSIVSPNWLKVSPLVVGTENLVISTTDPLDVGSHYATLKLCRENNLSICKEATIYILIMPRVCFEIPTGLVVPDLSVFLNGIQNNSKA